MTAPDDPTTTGPSAEVPRPRPRATFAATPSTILAGTPSSRAPEPPPAPEPTAPARTSRRRTSGWRPDLRRGPAALVAAVALALAVAVVLAVVVTHLSGQNGGQSAGDTAAVERAATTGTQAALSYNYQHLAGDEATAEKDMTPSFIANFKHTMADSVQSLATKYHAVSTATVEGAGVGSMSSSKATVLVFVDQTVTNSQLSAPRLDRSRVEVSLVKSGGTWLINNLSPI